VAAVADAVGGEGVAALLAGFTADVTEALCMAGVASPGAVTRGLVTRAW
jgi:hypothetical protein